MDGMAALGTAAGVGGLVRLHPDHILAGGTEELNHGSDPPWSWRQVFTRTCRFETTDPGEDRAHSVYHKQVCGGRRPGWPLTRRASRACPPGEPGTGLAQ